MCTIVKVKRKITDDPVDCLIIECKKQRFLSTDDSRASSSDSTSCKREAKHENLNQFEPIKQILKYIGSASKEDEISDRIKELNSKRSINGQNFVAESVYKSEKSLVETSKKNLLTSNQSSNQNREHKGREKNKESVNYIVLSKKRGFDDNELKKSESLEDNQKIQLFDNVNIIDVISSEYFDDEKSVNEISKDLNEDKKKEAIEKKHLICNGVEMVREKCKVKANKSAYVYDIYYSQTNPDNLDFLQQENIEIKSHGLYEESELMDNHEPAEEKEEFYEDEDDSNDEQNWRNDYPEEDEDNYEEENIDDEYQADEAYGGRYEKTYLENDSEDYEEYAYGYGEDDLHEKKLANYMKKSLVFDSDSDDFDEFRNDDQPIDHSYNAYKKRILKEFKKDYKDDI